MLKDESVAWDRAVVVSLCGVLRQIEACIDTRKLKLMFLEMNWIFESKRVWKTVSSLGFGF